MMPHSFLEQAKGTDSLDASSSDDPFPMGVFKFLKVVFSSFLFQAGKEGAVILPFKPMAAQRFVIRVNFQKYMKGVAVLSGIF